MAADAVLGNLVWKITGDNKNLDKSIDQSKRKVSGFKSMLGGLKGVSLAVGGALAAMGITSLGKKFAKLSIDFEQTRTSFITFLKDAEKADKTLADLQNLSVITPFTIDQINKGGKSLLAFGTSADKLTGTLSKIGDVAAGTGKDFNELVTIYGKAQVAGTIYAEDINQLVEAGVPIISEFAKQLGVTESEVKKLASEGKIGFNELETAFENLTSQGGLFFNLMADQSKILGGRISTLEGNFSLFGRAIGDQLTPYISLAVDGMNKMITSMLGLDNQYKRDLANMRKRKAQLDINFELLDTTMIMIR